MRIGLRGLSLLLSAAVVAALPAQGNFGFIEGVVTNSAKEPLSGVQVALAGQTAGTPNRSSTTTDTSGRFSIRDLPAGRHQILLTKDGFKRPYSSPAIAVTLAERERVGNLKLILEATSTISGEVVDQGGKPAPSVSVRLMMATYSPSGVRWLSGGGSAAVSTDAKGKYRITGVVPGEYYLIAVPGSGGQGFITSFYPGFVSPENATLIKVLPGMDLERFDFSLVREALYSVRVKAPRPAGVPSTGNVRFSLRPVSRGKLVSSIDQTTAFTSAGDDVYVSPPAPSGSYTLDVIWSTQNHRVQVPVEIVDKNVDLGTAMPKESNLTITGFLHGIPAGTNFRRTFVSLDDIQPGVGSVLILPTAPNGAFRLERVPEGKYLIVPATLLGSEKLYIASARLGGRDVLGDLFELNDGSSGSLEVTLASGVGRVQGTLLNSRDEPVGFGRVVLAPPPHRRRNSHLFFTAVSNHAGAFSLENVPPGEYDVFAWEFVELDAYRNEDFLRQFEGRGSKLSVSPNSQASIRIQAIAGP
jgi:hypothetical protein